MVFAKIVERRPQNSSRVCPGLDGIAGRLRAGVWPISKLAAEAACHPGQGPPEWPLDCLTGPVSLALQADIREEEAEKGWPGPENPRKRPQSSD